MKITLPKELKTTPDDAEIVEWLEWGLGMRNDIKMSNPLVDTDLRDCEVSADECIIDGKPIKL
jgi:hypothetical protein